MSSDSWQQLMDEGVTLRDSGQDKKALHSFYGAAFDEAATDQQVAKSHQALMITYRKLGMLTDAHIHAINAKLAAAADGDTLLQARVMRDHAEVIHEMALRERGALRRKMLDQAADMLLESGRLIRSLSPIDVAEDAATSSFLALVKYHLNGAGKGDAARAVAQLNELDRLGEPHHVYHVNALIRYIRILAWGRRGPWARKALELLPKAVLESRHWDVLIARHFGDRGYRLIKRGYQLIKR